MPTPMNQTAIPSVTNLRKQLGYDDAKRKIFHEFKNAMLSSRDVFVTDEGLRDLESLEDENPPGLRSARERSRTVRAHTVDKGPNESELTDDASGYSGISRDPYLVPQSPDLGAQTPTVASRSSTRQRKARREPEWATEEQYWAAGESPEHPSSLGSIDNNLGAPDGATFVTPTRPTVEDAPQEDPVNDFIDEWTMQQNADTEAILTTTDIPKDRAMALNTTREEEAAERPDVALGVLSVHPSTRAVMSEPVVPEETAAKAGSQRGDNAESNHLSDVEELQFIMETSNAEVEGVIEVGQEEQFEEMKAKFEKAIRMEIARSTTSGQVLVRITIDVRTGRDPKEEMDIENIRFSWS
ncbi:hypothetical protein K4K58_004071 [Colletotrichum sp. SAR11_239]|nr:hypothetical protein K4K58_004071 [Colletotrichum sp. SAR11_239]